MTKVDENINKELEYVNCNLCNGNDYSILPAGKIRSNSHKQVKVVVCKRCGLIYLNPRWTCDTYDQFYKDEYRKSVGSKSDTCTQWSRYQKAKLRGSRWLSFCQNFVSTGAKVLDIGCSNGAMLQVFKYAGYDVTGVEPGLAESQFGREILNLNIFTGTLKEAEFEYETFDLILIIASIDHLQDPLATLKQLLKLCKPGGYLFIDTYDSLQLFRGNRFFPKMDHCYYYTAATIHSLVSRAGWEVVKLDKFSKFSQPSDISNIPHRYKDVGVAILARKSELEVPKCFPDAKKLIKEIKLLLRWHKRLLKNIKIISRTYLKLMRDLLSGFIKRR